jgi:hypothetical protein
MKETYELMIDFCSDPSYTSIRWMEQKPKIIGEREHITGCLIFSPKYGIIYLR